MDASDQFRGDDKQKLNLVSTTQFYKWEAGHADEFLEVVEA